MIVSVFIEQHERFEAVEAYKDRLNADQLNIIFDAPDNALIRLDFNIGQIGTTVQIIEEG